MPEPAAAPALTDRQQLRDVAYATSNLLADRAALYAARVPPLDLKLWVAAQLPADLPGPVIDVGCGPGWYLPVAAKATGRPAFGFDLSYGMAREARTPAGVADAQTLPLRTASVGAVLLLHMLYHVPDPALALREARRVVHPAGVVAVMTNTATHLLAMRKLLGAELRRRGIQPFSHPEQHFDDATGRPILDAAFSRVDEHRLDATIHLDRPGPAIAHLATARHLYPALDDGAWQDVMDSIAARIEVVVDRDGHWTTPTSSVFYLCRP